jgi:hypothetical protein
VGDTKCSMRLTVVKSRRIYFVGSLRALINVWLDAIQMCKVSIFRSSLWPV